MKLVHKKAIFSLPSFQLKKGDLLSKSPYSVRMRKNTDQKTLNTDLFHAAITDLFSNPWNHYKNFVSLIFSGSIERDQ